MIPVPALALGLAGAAPFVYAAAALLFPFLAIDALPPASVLEVYGVVILAFMAGCHWGFAATVGERLWLWLGLSVIPAILIFFAVLWFGGKLVLILTIAFPALLIFDYVFDRAGLTPVWWMTLRVVLTTLATTSLVIGTVA